MRRYPRIFLLLCCTLWTGLAAAQLEVIPLKSRTVDEVLPVLLPLVEPGGTLTGMNNQLFLRSSPANQAEIKRALAAIDRPARRLVIHVALDRQQVQADRGAAVSGSMVSLRTGLGIARDVPRPGMTAWRLAWVWLPMAAWCGGTSPHAPM